MPNWNMNNMVVKGRNENVKNVLRFIKENYLTEKILDKPEMYGYILDFEKYLPTPKSDKGEIIDGWYDWRLENWGCKWSPYSDQYNYLIVKYKDGKVEHFDEGGYNRPDKQFEFNESNIDKLLDIVDNIQEVEFNNSFETPWGPPCAIIRNWYEKYKGIELINKYYEPGCCFAGKIGFDENDMWIDEYYEGWIDEDFTTFLLEEDFESIEWYDDIIGEMITVMYEEEKGKEFVDKLIEKVSQQLLNEKENRKCAVLITEIQNKHHEYMINKKEKGN